MQFVTTLPPETTLTMEADYSASSYIRDDDDDDDVVCFRCCSSLRIAEYKVM